MKTSWISDPEMHTAKDQFQELYDERKEELIDIFREVATFTFETVEKEDPVRAFLINTSNKQKYLDNLNLSLIEEGERDNRRKIECADRCSYCCYQHVVVTTIEALYIMRHLIINRAKIPDFRTNADLVKDLSHTERFKQGIACPLLKDKRCSVYEDRPSACRSYFSFSKQACRNGFLQRKQEGSQTAPTLGTGPMYAMQVSMAVDYIYHKMGFQVEHLELAEALAQAADPSIVTRWFKKERPFIIPEDDISYPVILEACAAEAGVTTV